jgi:cell division protein FtsB
MDYPKKPRYFKSEFEIEVDRRKAITSAYQTLCEELYAEQKRLKERIAKLQKGNNILKRVQYFTEIDLERRKENVNAS